MNVILSYNPLFNFVIRIVVQKKVHINMISSLLGKSIRRIIL